jgi:TonB family protein
MRIKILAIVANLLLADLGVVCFAQRHKSSTPEERAKAVQLAHSLETNPLGADANKARKWLDKWIYEVPDISVPSCSGLTKTSGKSKPKYAQELTTQMKASVAAFVIEQPDQAEDPNKRIMAGVTGMLNAYRSLLKIDPKAQWDFLDALIEKQSRNEVDRNVREVMVRCSEVPLSDRNKNSYQAGDTVYAPIEVSRNARIKSKPEPEYTNEAKVRDVQGTVILQVVLASSGRVTDIEVLQGLPYGLTESCISATRRIKFEPAIKEGHPVSILVTLEYHLRLY